MNDEYYRQSTIETFEMRRQYVFTYQIAPGEYMLIAEVYDGEKLTERLERVVWKK